MPAPISFEATTASSAVAPESRARDQVLRSASGAQQIQFPQRKTAAFARPSRGQRHLESLTKPINKSLADDGASQGEQSEMSQKRTLETSAQLAEAGKPGMDAFGDPTILAEPVVLLDATASNPGSDAPLAQLPSLRPTIEPAKPTSGLPSSDTSRNK